MKVPKILRRFLERTSRGVVFTRRLPRDLGALPLRISPGASLTYWRGLRTENLNDLFDFVRHEVRAGDTVWDIGANMGLLTFSAAHRVGPTGRVLAFEPDWWSCTLLHQSRLLNPGLARRVQVLPVAVSDSASLLTLIIPGYSRAATHLEIAGGAGADMVGAERDRLLVPTVTLDWVAGSQPAPDVIKIDVDGAEHRVLLGALSLLRTKRPKILIEVYERNADAVGQLLHDLGYRMFSYESGEAGRRPVTRPTYNTLALPA
jgi:FkbM family methyltransferase